MDLDRIPVIGMLVRRMDFLGARQRVIAQNVANADTPGYQPRDMAPDAFARHVASEMGMAAQGVAPVGLAATSAGHLAGTLPAAKPGQATTKANDYETAPSGNAVVLEEEMSRLTETQMDYDTMTSIYRKQIQMLKTAWRGGSSS
ncbi:flagellar basal body rod protein FlgB [Zavarzinia sp.]|uniref:flagellar basal body rod protein FlgB n=1 Tax=Zavarzinia sp. TaxID=2027920 RepID=UPI003565F638